MPQPLANIVVHTIFSTKDRQPFLRDPNIRSELHHYTGGILNGVGCQPIIVGGIEDHIHLLSSLSRTITPADMVKEVKRSSSAWIKTRGLGGFSWQSGYGIFSISFSHVPLARDYIARQEEHHRTVSFQEEFRAFLNRYELTSMSATSGTD